MIRRGLATALAVLSCGWLCAGPLLAGSAAAAPLSIEQCTTTSGAIVAVDFGHWGGPIVRACGSTPTTGFTLLNQGGFRSTGTSHDGPAFVCRIASASYRSGTSYPTPANDPCVRTSPSNAYWSFWHANPGQSGWSYSSVGATSYQPSPGSVELWQFGATNRSGSSGQPAVSPAALRAGNAPQAARPATTAMPRSPRSSSAAPAKPGTPVAPSSRPSSAGWAPAPTPGPASTVGASPPTHASPAAPVSTAAAATVPPSSVTPARGRSAVPRSTVAASPGPASPGRTGSGTTTTPATTARSYRTVSASVASADQSYAAGGPAVVDAAQPTDAGPAGHGSARGVVIGIVLVVALGVAGALTAARRSRP